MKILYIAITAVAFWICNFALFNINCLTDHCFLRKSGSSVLVPDENINSHQKSSADTLSRPERPVGNFRRPVSTADIELPFLFKVGFLNHPQAVRCEDQLCFEKTAWKNSADIRAGPVNRMFV